MAWKCISSDCAVRVFTISDEIEVVSNRFIEFLQNVSPGFYAMLIMSIIGVFIFYMFLYIRRAIRSEV